MATDVAIGIRRKEAIKRIEAAIAGDSDYRLEVVRKSQYGQAMMILQTIEAIADYIENAPKAPTESAVTMAVPAKYLLAEELARNGGTKAQIIEALLSEESETENATP